MTSSSGVAAAGQAPDLANLRENYVSTGIDEKALPSEPHVLMDKWVEAACNSKDVSDQYPSSPYSSKYRTLTHVFKYRYTMRLAAD